MEWHAGDSRHRLTPDQITYCVQACAFIRLPAAIPDYFREYLARWAGDERPAVADTVRHLRDAERLDLFAYVRDLQRQLR